MKGFILLSLFLFFFIIHSFGQSKVSILGKIVDKNYQGIEAVSVNNLSSNHKTKTDKEGFFSLNNCGYMDSLEVSHIGYKTQFFSINNYPLAIKIHQDTIWFEIHLTEKPTTLPEVQITNSSTEFYGGKGIVIYDFEVSGESILILSSIERKQFLMEYNQDKQLVSKLQIPGNKGIALVKDCFDNIHLQTKDSAFQVFINSNLISLMYPITIQNYKSNLDPCICENSENIIIKKYGKLNQTLNYVALDKKSHYSKLLITIRNTESESFARLIDNDYQRLKSRINRDPNSRYMNYCSVKNQRQLMNLELYRNMVTAPLISPIFEINDGFVVFDLPTNCIKVYNKNCNIEKQISIEFHLKTGRGKSILKDSKTNKLYSVKKRGGIISVNEINFSNGSIGKEIIINDHAFPQKLKILDGRAFYLYADIYEKKPEILYFKNLN